MPLERIEVKKIAVTVIFFFIAGLCEIGGYPVWLWLQDVAYLIATRITCGGLKNGKHFRICVRIPTYIHIYTTYYILGYTPYNYLPSVNYMFMNVFKCPVCI